MEQRKTPKKCMDLWADLEWQVAKNQRNLSRF